MSMLCKDVVLVGTVTGKINQINLYTYLGKTLYAVIFTGWTILAWLRLRRREETIAKQINGTWWDSDRDPKSAARRVAACAWYIYTVGCREGLEFCHHDQIEFYTHPRR